MFPIPYAESITYYALSVYCYRRGNEGQSVSEASRMKNILHSKKVAIRLLKFLRKEKSNLDAYKIKYLEGGLAGHCIWHFRGLTFFAPDEEKRQDLIRFDDYVRGMSREVYRLMVVPASNRMPGDVKIVKHMRQFNYRTYNIYGMYRKAKRKFQTK